MKDQDSKEINTPHCNVQSTASDISVTPEGTVNRLVALGRALSDPIRVRMIALMVEGPDCCDLPNNLGVPRETGDKEAGICVCEFMSYYNLKQSKVSYHLGKLKDAGLIKETRQGKWNFYSLDKEAVKSLIEELVNLTHPIIG